MLQESGRCVFSGTDGGSPSGGCIGHRSQLIGSSVEVFLSEGVTVSTTSFVAVN